MEFGRKLPPITLDTASKNALIRIIPQLVLLTTQCPVPPYKDDKYKPPWWPQDIPWTSPSELTCKTTSETQNLKVLRRVVLSCYRYHKAEDLLDNLGIDSYDHLQLGCDSLDIINLTEDNEDSQGSSIDESPVFVCCFCTEQYDSLDEVSQHQNVCQKRMEESSYEALAESASSPSGEDCPNPSDHHPNHSSGSGGSATNAIHALVENTNLVNSAGDMSRKLEKSLSEASVSQPDMPVVLKSSNFELPLAQLQPQSPRDFNNGGSGQRKPAPRFVPILKTRSQKRMDQIMDKHKSKRLMKEECKELKNVEKRGAWWNRRNTRKGSQRTQHPSQHTTIKSFTASLGLVLKSDIKNEVKKEDVDLDCEITAVEGPISMLPPPPSSSSSPRASMSLMSQLSRDSESSSSRRSLSFCFVEDEWADREALEEGREPPVVNSLLTLDFSSPLGQRVKKYLKGEGVLNIVKDPENFCLTETNKDSYSKLRHRLPELRVTYKKKKRANKFVHLYKFNREQRVEYKKRLKSGLTARARMLSRLMRPCSVHLKRLKESEIKKWTEKTIILRDKIYYDDDLCITQIDIPQSVIERGQKSATQSSDRSAAMNGRSVCPVHSSQHAHKQHQHAPRQNQHGPKENQHASRQNQHAPRQHTSGPHRPLHPHSFHHRSHSHHSSCGQYKPLPAHYSTSSSPHIPNIFRNRTGHAPSPPRHFMHRPSHLQPIHRPSSPSATQLLASRQTSNPDSPLSGYSHTPNYSNGAHSCNNNISASSNSRRKQPMTNLRREDFVDSRLSRVPPTSKAHNPTFTSLTPSPSSSHNNSNFKQQFFTSSQPSSERKLCGHVPASLQARPGGGGGRPANSGLPLVKSLSDDDILEVICIDDD